MSGRLTRPTRFANIHTVLGDALRARGARFQTALGGGWEVEVVYREGVSWLRWTESVRGVSVDRHSGLAAALPENI
jgi:hypothetical protein